MPHQPLGKLIKARRQCAEAPRLTDRLARLVAKPDRRRNLHLVHVEPRGTGVDNMQRVIHHGSISSGETTGGDGMDGRGSTRSGA